MLNNKVCSLIYESKKIINLESIIDKVDCKNNHTCVIVDTGIYPHIDFCLVRNRLIKFVDLINGKEFAYDDNGHGTFITGVLCGNSITSKYTFVEQVLKVSEPYKKARNPQLNHI